MKYSTLFSLIAFILIVFLYIFYFPFSSFLPFLFCFGLVFISSRTKFYKSFPTISSKKILPLSYLLISLVGLLLAVNYNELYGSFFAPFGDDSTYFYNIFDLSKGNDLYKTPTLYEIVLVPWYKFVSLFLKDITNIHLLPINWFFAAIVVTASLVLARLVTKRDFSILLPFLALIGNSIFLDSVANLYRDGFALVLFLGALIAAMRSKFKSAIILILLCGGVRMATGGIAGLGVLWIFSIEKWGLKSINKSIIIPSIFIGIFLILDLRFNLGGYMRSFLASGSANVTVIEMALDRADRLVTGGAEASTIEKILNLGPIGYLMAPFATVFAPLEFLEPIKTLRVHVRQVSSILVTGLYPRAIWGWFTIVLWIFVGPRLVLGLLKSRKGNVHEKLFLLLFALIVLAVTFVSFQARHRTMFMVLFPLFIAISDKYYPTNNRTIIFLGFMFFCGILFFNLFQSFLSL